LVGVKNKINDNYLAERKEHPDKKPGQAISLREERLLARKNLAYCRLIANFTDSKSLRSVLDSE